jgi:hypothetical protein
MKRGGEQNSRSLLQRSGSGVDHGLVALSEALSFCRSIEPRVAEVLEAILGTDPVVEMKSSSCPDCEHLMSVLKLFVSIAMDVDERRLGSVLASIRYLAAEAERASRIKRVH